MANTFDANTQSQIDAYNALVAQKAALSAQLSSMNEQGIVWNDARMQQVQNQYTNVSKQIQPAYEAQRTAQNQALGITEGGGNDVSSPLGVSKTYGASASPYQGGGAGNAQGLSSTPTYAQQLAAQGVSITPVGNLLPAATYTPQQQYNRAAEQVVPNPQPTAPNNQAATVSKMLQMAGFSGESARLAGDITARNTQSAYTTQYTPYGDRTQQELLNTRVAVDKKSGEIGYYQVPINPDTGKPRTGMYGLEGGGILIGGGSRSAAQSGMFSTGVAGTPDIRTQYNPEKYAPTANVKMAEIVRSSPDKFSRLGAEAYFGQVYPLDDRKLTPDSKVSRYPEWTGNLANLVQQVAPNKSEYRGANIPWSTPLSSPDTMYMDIGGIYGEAPSAYNRKATMEYEGLTFGMGGSAGIQNPTIEDSRLIIGEPGGIRYGKSIVGDAGSEFVGVTRVKTGTYVKGITPDEVVNGSYDSYGGKKPFKSSSGESGGAPYGVFDLVGKFTADTNQTEFAQSLQSTYAKSESWLGGVPVFGGLAAAIPGVADYQEKNFPTSKVKDVPFFGNIASDSAQLLRTDYTQGAPITVDASLDTKRTVTPIYAKTSVAEDSTFGQFEKGLVGATYGQVLPEHISVTKAMNPLRNPLERPYDPNVKPTGFVDSLADSAYGYVRNKPFSLAGDVALGYGTGAAFGYLGEGFALGAEAAAKAPAGSKVAQVAKGVTYVNEKVLPVAFYGMIGADVVGTSTAWGSDLDPSRVGERGGQKLVQTAGFLKGVSYGSGVPNAIHGVKTTTVSSYAKVDPTMVSSGGLFEPTGRISKSTSLPETTPQTLEQVASGGLWRTTPYRGEMVTETKTSRVGGLFGEGGSYQQFKLDASRAYESAMTPRVRSNPEPYRTEFTPEGKSYQNPDWVRWSRETNPSSRWNRFSNENAMMSFGGIKSAMPRAIEMPGSTLGVPRAMVENIGSPKSLTARAKTQPQRSSVEYSPEGMSTFAGREVITNARSSSTAVQNPRTASGYVTNPFAYSTPTDEMRQIGVASTSPLSRTKSADVYSIAGMAARSDVMARASESTSVMSKATESSSVRTKASDMAYNPTGILAGFMGTTSSRARDTDKTSAWVSEMPMISSRATESTFSRVTENPYTRATANNKVTTDAWTDTVTKTTPTQIPIPPILPGLPTWQPGSSVPPSSRGRGRSASRETINIRSSLDSMFGGWNTPAPRARRAPTKSSKKRKR